MTTTITIKTHDWPVKVTTVDSWQRGQTNGIDQQLVTSETTTTETVPPHSERSYHITDSRSVAFDEMPRPTSELGPE